MKKFNIILILALFIGFTACENDEEKMYVNPTDQVSAPVLNMNGLSDIILNANNINLVPAILKWTKSDFGKDVLVEYSMEIANNQNFNNADKTVIGSNIYFKSLTASELSNKVIDKFNGLDANDNPVKVNLFIRIAAKLTLENPTVTIPPDVLYSNAVNLSVTPYYIPAAYPAQMYMIGVDFGNWIWDSEGVVEMVPTYGFEGNFWAIRYINADQGFKWCPVREWKGDFFSLGEDIGFYIKDGNAFVQNSGLYMIYMDMANKKISIEPAKVYGMGDCFGGWNTATYPFAIEDKTMTITTASAGEVRMYAASDIAPVEGDWWKMEFVFFNGKIAFRGTGNDQDRVQVGAGKKVILDFNAGTAEVK